MQDGHLCLAKIEISFKFFCPTLSLSRNVIHGRLQSKNLQTIESSKPAFGKKRKDEKHNH
jgi:hypothetical protein